MPELSQYKKEEREVERLIERGKPPRSRKYRPKRGPKHDNRRQTIKEKDPDLDKSDSDLSMNYKVIGGSNLADIALMIFSVDQEPEHVKKIKQQRSEIDKLFKVLKLPENLKSNLWNYLNSTYFEKLEHETVDLGEAIKLIGKITNEYNDENVNKLTSDLVRIEDREKISKFFIDNWPFGPGGWGRKAAFIFALSQSIKILEKNKSLPDYLSQIFQKGKKQDKELVENLVKGLGEGSFKKLKGTTALQFAALTAIRNVVDKDPFNVDEGSLKSEIDQAFDQVYDELVNLKQVEFFMKEWNGAVSEISKLKSGEPWTYEQGFDKAVKSLDKMMTRKSEFVDLPKIMDGFRENLEKDGKLPKQLEHIFEPFLRAASNENGYSEPMSRTAAFHGYIHQGHPEGPFPGWQSLDKRFFTNENYESIVKFAEDLLEQDWFKSGWDDGSPDAKMRAALDLSIHLADDNLYQAKIDVETYNLLLGRLNGSNVDLFSETMVFESGKKRASAMSKRQSIQNLLRLANSLREKDPVQAFQIVKDVRSLIANDEPIEGKPEQTAGTYAEKPAEESQEQTAQGGADVDVKELQKAQKDLDDALNKEDIEALVNAFNEMGKAVKKVSARLAASTCMESTNMEVTPPSVLPTPPEGGGAQSGSGIELKGLAGLEEEDQAALLEEIKKGSKDLKDHLDNLDIDAFMKGYQSIGDLLEQKTASLVEDVDSIVNTLIRVAHKHPETRGVLLPIIIAAKKKKKKKTPPKKEEKKKSEEKKPPSDKAPPFGGKKAPPFGGKKVSTVVSVSDMNW